jgi:hypothetical protein
LGTDRVGDLKCRAKGQSLGLPPSVLAKSVRAVSIAARGAGRISSFIYRRTRAERLAHALPLDPNTLAQLPGAARSVGLAHAEIERAIMPMEATRES